MEPTGRLRFVGRKAELGELDAELRRATGGELRCVLLLADPGMGKSRLAAELLSRHRREVIGLRARAYAFGRTTSFGLWAEALEGHLRGLDPGAIRQLCDGFATDLAVLLPSVAVADVPAQTNPPRPRLLAGIAFLLEKLAQHVPVVLLFDDVHLADASSWEAFNYVARNLRHARLLLLAVARPGELAGQQVPTEITLALEQEEILRRLSLGPLDRPQLGDLARAVLNAPASDALVDWLDSRSRGIPLFAIGLLRALLEEGGELSAPRLQRIPEGLGERIGIWVAQLSDLERATLEAIVVLGRRTELGDVADITKRSVDQLAPVLERLLQARLITEDEQPGMVMYEVAHPLIQEAIYQAMGAARRRALHRLAARMLMQSSRLADAAPHFAWSAKLGDEEAIDALVKAVTLAESRGLYREALPILEALLGLLPTGDQRWLRVVDVMARQADWVTDHMGDAFAHTGVRAMREIEHVLAGSPDLHLQGLVQFRLASFLAWGTGDLDAARQAVERALALFENAGDRSLSLLAANERAWITGLAGDLSGQEQAARRVAETAGAAKETVPMMQALSNVGRAALLAGRFPVAEDALRNSIAIARAEGKVYRLSWNLSGLAWSFALAGQMTQAQALLVESKQENADYRESLVLEIGAHVQWMAGDFAGCVGAALESAAWHADHPSRRRAAAMAMAAMAAAEMGQLDRAAAYLEVASRVFQERDWYWASHICTWATGTLTSRNRSTASASKLLSSAANRLLAMGALPYAAFVLVDLCDAASQTGDRATIERAVDELAAIAKQLDRDLYRALSALARAVAEIGNNVRNSPIVAARESVALLENSHYSAFLGRALFALGRALSPTDRGAATQALERAASVFVSCGAQVRRDECLEALSALGHRGRRAVAATLGPESLTRREREVVRLAADGETGHAIARRLFISERTVETHLENAYAKLGVGSKLELVRRAGELKL